MATIRKTRLGGRPPATGNMGRRKFLEITAAGLAIPGASGLLAACGSSSSSKPSSSTHGGKEIRLGFQTNMWGMPILVALESGAFKKAGATVDQTRVSTGGKARDLMVAGKLDMGTFSTPTFVIGAAKSKLQAVAVVAYAGETLAIVARKGITSVSQLKGKKIAMIPGASTTQVTINKILPAFDLHPGDYHKVNVKVPNMVESLASGSVDATATIEPANSIMVAKGLGTRLVTGEKWDRLPVLLTVTPEFAKATPDAVTAACKAMLNTENLFKNDPAKAAGLILDYYKSQGLNVDDKIMKDATSRLDVAVGLTPKLKDYVQGVVQQQMRLGHISHNVDVSSILVDKYMKQAGGESGR
ncbi:MAG: ABC transporter substrate-binding protein [Nocardioidaceae bacterium]